MTELEMIAAPALTPTTGFRGPRERQRIEGTPGTPFEGFWFEVDGQGLTNGEVEVLRRNHYWHDLLRLMAPHIIAWNYVAEVVEGVEEPAVHDDAGNELVPARTVYRITGSEPISPPAEAGVDALRRVWLIESARGVAVDDGTLGWMLQRLRGYRDELPEQIRKLLASLSASAGGSSSETSPGGSDAPSPTPSPRAVPATSTPSKARSRSTRAASGRPSG